MAEEQPLREQRDEEAKSRIMYATYNERIATRASSARCPVNVTRSNCSSDSVVSVATCAR